jgi:hypothetical protein
MWGLDVGEMIVLKLILDSSGLQWGPVVDFDGNRDQIEIFERLSVSKNVFGFIELLA